MHLTSGVCIIHWEFLGGPVFAVKEVCQHTKQLPLTHTSIICTRCLKLLGHTVQVSPSVAHNWALQSCLNLLLTDWNCRPWHLRLTWLRMVDWVWFAHLNIGLPMAYCQTQNRQAQSTHVRWPSPMDRPHDSGAVEDRYFMLVPFWTPFAMSLKFCKLSYA